MFNSSLGPWLVATCAICCNVLAQISMQRAEIHSLSRAQIWWQPAIALAVASYGLSFVLTAWLYARFQLSIIAPSMAAAIFVLLLLYDGWWLGQGVPMTRWLGVLLLCLGVFLINRPHGP